MFTAQDVENAYFAKRVLADAKIQECSPKAWIAGFLGGDEDPSLLQDFTEGCKVLKTAKIVSTNDTMDVTLSSSAAAERLREKGIDSPVIEVSAGWVAASEMKKVVALKRLS